VENLSCEIIRFVRIVRLRPSTGIRGTLKDCQAECYRHQITYPNGVKVSRELGSCREKDFALIGDPIVLVILVDSDTA